MSMHKKWTFGKEKIREILFWKPLNVETKRENRLEISKTTLKIIKAPKRKLTEIRTHSL